MKVTLSVAETISILTYYVKHNVIQDESCEVDIDNDYNISGEIIFEITEKEK